MLLDVVAGAQYLKVGQSTLRRWISQGQIPVVRLGRRVLIRQEALDELIQRAERPAREAGNPEVVPS